MRSRFLFAMTDVGCLMVPQSHSSLNPTCASQNHGRTRIFHRCYATRHVHFPRIRRHHSASVRPLRPYQPNERTNGQPPPHTYSLHMRIYNSASPAARTMSTSPSLVSRVPCFRPSHLPYGLQHNKQHTTPRAKLCRVPPSACPTVYTQPLNEFTNVRARGSLHGYRICAVCHTPAAQASLDSES